MDRPKTFLGRFKDIFEHDSTQHTPIQSMVRLFQKLSLSKN